MSEGDEPLYHDQCRECGNFGIELETAGPPHFHCPDCGNEWWLLPEDDDDE